MSKWCGACQDHFERDHWSQDGTRHGVGAEFGEYGYLLAAEMLFRASDVGSPYWLVERDRLLVARDEQEAKDRYLAEVIAETYKVKGEAREAAQRRAEPAGGEKVATT